MTEVLKQALDLLNEVTPLKTDCGKVCGAICCRSAEEEETGMLLFPGEEDRYEDRDDFEMKPVPAGTLLICKGQCDRNLRPLACMIFPLLPVIREDGVKVATDQRAKRVCPLARQGRSSMDPAFVQTVRRVGNLLSGDPVQKAFLEELTEEQDALLQLRKQLGR